jgi:hypothetical protein
VNPRIKELARESGLLVYNPNGVPTKLEKFAELIVKECKRMCEVAQVGYLTHGLEKEASGAFSVKQYIEEYLGVEE